MGALDLASALGALMAVGAGGAAATWLRGGSAPTKTRTRSLWLLWAAAVTATGAVVVAVVDILIGWPGQLGAGSSIGCVAIPVAVACGRSSGTSRVAASLLVRTVVGGGLLTMVGGVYLVVVLGLGRAPLDEERTVLGLSMAAAAVACLLVFPVRLRLSEWVMVRVHGQRVAPEEALQTFGSRMSRAVPLDELLLQLVETLRKTQRLTCAEIWTGTHGALHPTVSIPDRGKSALTLTEDDRIVVAKARAQGNAWLRMWVPALLDGLGDAVVRAVPITHLGELLGLIVVARDPHAGGFADDEDQVLVDLARQIGLALHNVRLDSALQASLEELQRRNEELVASRARIVATADEARRHIERNLHDGAQQHLVALAVKLGLAKAVLANDPDAAVAMLDELRSDVQAALTEVRELAHGIYPPLLQERGLGEALNTAANRSPLPTSVVAEGIGRFSMDVETAVYFCCLEAIQNAGKHAGADAEVKIVLTHDGGVLTFEVRDDGEGFDTRSTAAQHGFVNMRDRLGAFGGELTVDSSSGHGTTIRGTIPALTA